MSLFFIILLMHMKLLNLSKSFPQLFSFWETSSEVILTALLFTSLAHRRLLQKTDHGRCQGNFLVLFNNRSCPVQRCHLQSVLFIFSFLFLSETFLYGQRCDGLNYQQMKWSFKLWEEYGMQLSLLRWWYNEAASVCHTTDHRIFMVFDERCFVLFLK